LEICHPDTQPQQLCDTHGTIPLTITTENKVAESVTQIPDFCAFLPPPTTPTVPGSVTVPATVPASVTVPGSVTEQAEEQAEEEEDKTEIWVYLVVGIGGSVACCVCFICICFFCGCWKRDEESKKLEESKEDGFVDPENKPATQSDQRYLGSDDEECNNAKTKKRGVGLTVGN